MLSSVALDSLKYLIMQISALSAPPALQKLSTKFPG